MNAEQRRSDMIVGFLMLGLAFLIGVESASIPAGVFDPIGSGQFPLYLSLCLGGLAAIMLFRATFAAPEATVDAAPESSKSGAWRFLVLAALVFGYCLAVSFEIAPFEISTSVFIVALGLFILGRKPRARDILRMTILAVFAAISVKLIFTKILYLSLP